MDVTTIGNSASVLTIGRMEPIITDRKAVHLDGKFLVYEFANTFKHLLPVHDLMAFTLI